MSILPTKQVLGATAEDIARRHLEQQGLHLVTRHYQARVGELDLVMQEGKTLVFVEVRYRQRTRFGDGVDSIDSRKQIKLTRTANHYLQTHYKNTPPPCRFDVVSISSTLGDPKIEWLQNAMPGF